MMKWERERERECDRVVWDEDANRRVELCSFKSTHWRCKGEKRVVLAGRHVMPQFECDFMKICFFLMKCAERERKREREANKLFYFFPLNRFQLLFNLDSDILLSFSLTWPLIQVSFHITWKTIHKNAMTHFRTLWNSHKSSKGPWTIESTGTRWSRNKSLNYYSLLIFIVYLNLLHDF